MKVSIALIDWSYPDDVKIPEPEVWDLHNGSTLMQLMLAFANGIIVEVRAVAESHEALDVLRGMAKGTGGCVPVVLTSTEKSRLWLYQEGDECYRQGEEDPGYVFLDPVPNPNLFDLK